MPNKTILLVEDSEQKAKDVYAVVSHIEEIGLDLVRAATMEEANRAISEGTWDLMILDISMDIRVSASGPQAGGHDTIGGLKVAERMFYLHKDVPTIILTAFDAFPSSRRGGAVLGLDDVRREASSLLSNLLVGCVRYGDAAWEAELRTCIVGALA